MTTSVHKNLTGSDLHEPKGADTALSGQVYVSNGAGSGVWTTASSVITNTAFTTGDLKLTHKTTADTSWILWSDGTIGDGSSVGTIRANADTSALFQLYWNNFNNATCAVSGGRGASAAADYAAHKTIALPTGAARALVVAGAGSGLTTRTLGGVGGVESVTLAAGHLPSHTSTGSNSISVSGTATTSGAAAVLGYTSGGNGPPLTGVNNSTVTSTGSNSITVTFTNTAVPFQIMQPTTVVNVMIKL